MSGMHTAEIKLLVRLQEKDAAIDATNKKINLFPEEIDDINEKFEEKKSAMAESKNLLSQIQVEKKDKEISMAQREADIKKHQLELNLVKENNAFKALITEIERDKEGRDALETDILMLFEKFDKASEEDKEIREEFEKTEEAHFVKIKEIEDAKKECEVSIETMIKERAQLAAKITEDMILDYEHIRKRRKNALIEAREDEDKFFCSGCNMVLVSRCVSDIKKKDYLGICDNCQRLLYLKKVVFEEKEGKENENK